MVAYCKKHIRAGILCSAVLFAVLPSLGYTETVKDFRDPEGRLFEDYRYFPPALVARAKVLFDEGYFINTDLYQIHQERVRLSGGRGLSLLVDSFRTY